MKAVKSKERKPLSVPVVLTCVAALAVSCLCLFAARWYVSTYGNTGFDSILFTLQSSLTGTESTLLRRFLIRAVMPGLCAAGAISIALFYWPREFGFLRRLNGLLGAVIALGLSAVMTVNAAVIVELDEYIVDMMLESELFEDEYVDPDTVQITFPQEKRNLVYIMLESMEISYLSEALGGGQEHNLIPELYELALNNTNFSHNDQVGGFHETSGASWTIGAMVAQTAGIPLKTPEDVEDWQNGYGKDGVFLPGVTNLTSILKDAGYHTSLMVGSDASFGGRKTYYETHGCDEIYDIVTAWKDGIVPSGYFVWWGMEDLYLFEYAKQELTEIAAQDQPFAFTMLTVDTHHIGGYQCEYCTDEYEETYEQSISCSSRQVLDFLQWLQEQPFYENTTVVITGDHCSMDKGYFDRNVDEDYQRMVYNVIINAPVSSSNTKNRQYCAMDLFPTTLAALGCQIQGNRLGLGTNLYSNVPTLAEKYGIERFNELLGRSSDYYAANFY
ncbi:MAG: LTA synthase family protein [Oscillospiraceae bacterium]|nr:LTA synthase family protein [Oscillospiraceae bacterium]